MILKHRDTEVLRFDWIQPFGVKNVEVNSAAERFLPLSFRDRIWPGDSKALTRAVEDWVMARKPPTRRKHIDKMLSYLGLSTGNPRDLLSVSKGLSLNDVYWIVPDDATLKWGDCNLYENEFSSVLAEMAFTGSGRHQEVVGVRSPEFTTDGALPKCWRRVKGFRFKHDKSFVLPTARMEVILYFLQKRIAEIADYRAKADAFIKIGQPDDTIKQEESTISSAEDLRSMIVAALKLFPTISRQQLSNRLNVGPATIARHIKALQEAGELKRVGSRKTGYWQVIERLKS